MRVRTIFLAAVAAFMAPVAWAAPRPDFEPPPAWVDVAPIPEPPPADGAAAVQVVLSDSQTRFSPDGDAYYDRRVFKVTRPEGLGAFKTQSFTWSPDTETIAIHTLAIRRGDQVIDLLRGGRDMSVLRRETNLERAMLDGRLTVSRQIDGLQTGDELEMAFTTTRKDPVVEGRAQAFEKMNFPGEVGRYRARFTWPDAAPVKWRATEGFAPSKVTQAGGWTVAEFDARNVKAPRPPEGAPLRFRRQGELEVSSYKDWAEVSSQMAPLYNRAARLTENSPLIAEAAAIAAAYPDDESRAFAALQLVESKTRYLFLGMNEGGYRPATADETWARKFGDCKGKTVLLLALLRELKLHAEPALVSMGAGDGLDERLPSLSAFNHVLIRLDIANRIYWLDGTRQGDVSGLAALRAPPWRWALPVRKEGAGLVQIAPTALVRPESETVVHMDASKGLDVPAPVKIEVRLNGEAANAMRQSLAQLPREDFERGMRQSIARSFSWIEIAGVQLVDDPAQGGLKIVMSGKADMDWRKNPDLSVREFRMPGGGQAGSFARREPGPDVDAPYAIVFPIYNRTISEVVLPNGGKGFTVRGPNDALTVGGFELKRVAAIEGGVARFISEARSITPEIPAGEAEAANRIFRRIAGEDSLIRAPL